MKKPKPYPARRTLVKRLDTAWSRYIRHRDGYKCVLCGSTYNVQCGHIFSRVAYSVRWDERNMFSQCSKCNWRHEYNAFPYIKWVEDHFGRAYLDDLQARWSKPSHFMDHELWEMCKDIEARLKQREENNEQPNVYREQPIQCGSGDLGRVD